MFIGHFAMRVAIRDLALLVVAASGSAEAFAPAPVGLSLRTSAVTPRVVNAQAVRDNERLGVAGLRAGLNNADKIGKIVPKTWKEGTDFARATKVGHVSCYPLLSTALAWRSRNIFNAHGGSY